MENSYILLDESADENVIGVYPQCNDFVKGTSKEEEERIYSFSQDLSKKEWSDTERPLTGIKLAGWARRSDCLSAFFPFPLLDRKALDVFCQFNLGHHQIIEVKVEKRGKVFDYYLINVMNIVEDYVDYPASRFEEFNPVTKSAPVPVAVKNLDDYIVKSALLFREKKWTDLRAVELVMTKDFPTEIDLFFSRELAINDFYVSERLYKALEANRITGLETRPVPTMRLSVDR